MPDFTIGIAVYKESDYLFDCLESIEKYTPQSYEVFVVNTFNPRKSIAWAWNVALNKGDSEFCVILNDDVIVTPRWLEDLSEYLVAHPSVGVVSPSLSSCANRQKNLYKQYSPNKNPRECSHDDILLIASQIQNSHFGESDVLPYTCGACMVFRRSLWEKFNVREPPFDAFHEGFNPAYGEEEDFCHLVSGHGLTNNWVKYAYVHHIGKATTNKVDDIDRQKCKDLLKKRSDERKTLTSNERRHFYSVDKYK